MDERLSQLRSTIDRVDRQLLDLLGERARAAQAIGHAKRQAGSPAFAPHREQAVYDRVQEQNPGPLSDRCIRAIWREIMSGCIALEHPIAVCHFGRPGAFTHQAARAKFGDSVSYAGVEDIATVFSEVEKGHADYGVVPIENSTDGSIVDTVDCFTRTSLRIVGELHLRIRHHLMARCARKDIRKIYSRNTVFAQCRQWLAANMPGVELCEVVSTTQGAERAANEAGAASIGNAVAASEFGLELVVSDIQDIANNTTRFVILAKPEKAAAPTGKDKTSLMFWVMDRPGALYEALAPFHRAGLSLSRIESRPSRRQVWEYVFFIDIVGHQADPPVAAALAEFTRGVQRVEVLGSYPQVSGAVDG